MRLLLQTAFIIVLGCQTLAFSQEEKVLNHVIQSVPVTEDFEKVFSMPEAESFQVGVTPVASLCYEGSFNVPLLVLYEDGTLMWLENVNEQKPPYKDSVLLVDTTFMMGQYKWAVLTPDEYLDFFQALETNEVFEKHGTNKELQNSGMTILKVIHGDKSLYMGTMLDIMENEPDYMMKADGSRVVIDSSKSIGEESLKGKLSIEPLEYQEFRASYLYTKNQFINLIPEDKSRINNIGLLNFSFRNYSR